MQTAIVRRTMCEECGGTGHNRKQKLFRVGDAHARNSHNILLFQPAAAQRRAHVRFCFADYHANAN